MSGEKWSLQQLSEGQGLEDKPPSAEAAPRETLYSSRIVCFRKAESWLYPLDLFEAHSACGSRSRHMKATQFRDLMMTTFSFVKGFTSECPLALAYFTVNAADRKRLLVASDVWWGLVGSNNLPYSAGDDGMGLSNGSLVIWLSQSSELSTGNVISPFSPLQKYTLSD